MLENFRKRTEKAYQACRGTSSVEGTLRQMGTTTGVADRCHLEDQDRRPVGFLKMTIG